MVSFMPKLGYPGNCFADQTGLELRDLSALAFQVLELKKCATTTGLTSQFSLDTVLVQVTFAVMKYYNKKQVGEERVYFTHSSI